MLSACQVSNCCSNYQLANDRTLQYFGIPDEKIVAIQVENRTEEECRVALLHTWSEQEGKQATCLKLIHELYHQGRCDLVDSLCSLIKLKSDVGPRDTPCDSLQPSSVCCCKQILFK